MSAEFGKSFNTVYGFVVKALKHIHLAKLCLKLVIGIFPKACKRSEFLPYQKLWSKKKNGA